MQQEITPRHIIIAVAIVLVIVGFFAWRSLSKPGKANINFGHFGGGELDARKRNVERYLQPQPGSTGNPSPSAPGNP
ncbi:MAG TPA: hypothetical protein VKU00_17635 [Chthonomonadaceae bacterium]|nr:hypothetical protein [Chthonomonadaceae bacterium]